MFTPTTAPPGAGRRRVRVCYLNTWAGPLEDAATYVARVPQLDLAPLVVDRNDATLLRKARIDCDWYAENTRAFSALQHGEIDFLPAWVTGAAGLLDLARAPRASREERWLVTTGHQPQALGAIAGRVFALLAQSQVRHLFYAFDEASRAMPSFGAIAPYLDILIHDESPLAPAAAARLRPDCHRIHRSWVANVVPFAAPFNATPEPKILFLGSPLGLSPHRRRQIDFLRGKYKDRFVASHDHSVAVTDRFALNRYRVGLCPEGRKFTSPAMGATHTDRPFWSGCLGLIPVSEDSRHGGRLEALHRTNLIVRYAHGDLDALAAACEQALGLAEDERRQIYDHFNRHETVGTVVAEAIGAVGARSM